MDASGRQIRKSFQLNIKGKMKRLMKKKRISSIDIHLDLVPITFHGDLIQYAALGEPVVIKCQVQANPSAEISWFKGSEKNRIGSSSIIEFQRVVMIISSSRE